MTKEEAHALLAQWRNPGPFTVQPHLGPTVLEVARLTGETILAHAEADIAIPAHALWVSTVVVQTRDKHQLTLVNEAIADGRLAFFRFEKGELRMGDVLTVVVTPDAASLV